MSRSWSILRTAAALAALTGCAAAAQPGPAPSHSGPPAYYTGLTSECPVLNSPESVRFTGSRVGKHLPFPVKLAAFDRIDCGWRPPSGEPPWVTVTVTIQLGPATAHEEAERRFAEARDYAVDRADSFSSRAVRAVEQATPHGPSFVVADASDSQATSTSDDLSRTTLVGNAVVIVMFIEKRDATRAGSARADELTAGLAATSEAVTADVASQLVRAPI